jgi:osmotically-inducible protein OsmY
MVSKMAMVYRLLLCWALVFGCYAIVLAQDANTSGQSAPDNTKANAHRRANSQTNADQQSENNSDRAITEQVRKAIVKNKAVSSYAHNVKIITQNGQVTLAGPVHSAEEKRALEDAAVSVVGAGNVKNELQLAPKE